MAAEASNEGKSLADRITKPDATQGSSPASIPNTDGASEVLGGSNLQEPEYDVEVKLSDLQADPNNPLFSVKSFEDLGLYVHPLGHFISIFLSDIHVFLQAVGCFTGSLCDEILEAVQNPGARPTSPHAQPSHEHDRAVSVGNWKDSSFHSQYIEPFGTGHRRDAEDATGIDPCT
jgi:hypothetical protein